MTENDKFERLVDFISDKLELIKEYKKNSECIESNELFGAIVELTTMIFTTKELTEVSENQIEKHLISEINMTIKELQGLENSFY